MKTLFYSIHGFDQPSIEQAAQGKHDLAFTEESLSSDTAHLARGFDAVALFSADNASAEVLEKLHAAGVKYVTLRSVGYDHVDLQVAKKLGIRVANVPAYSPYAIAEHSVALLLAVNRKIVRSQELIQRNDYRLDTLIGFDLNGKTIGVVGTGHIGSAFVRIMHGFGCRILACDPAPDDTLRERYNVEYVALEELCRQSDVISVNCPLNNDTKYMFNAATFALMKRGVVFINTARGAIVHTQHLLDALDQGIVAYAGLDVYEYEKSIFFRDRSTSTVRDELFERVRAHENILLTAHQAFLTNEALHGIATTTIDNLDQWATRGVSVNEV